MIGFHATGNLADAPSLKHVTVNGEPEVVAELRVYFDRNVADGQGGYADKGGFWADVSYWGERAERAARLLRKGARVFVMGAIVQDRWTDKDSGEEKSAMRVKADYLALDLSRVEVIEFRQRAPEPASEPA